MKELQVIGIIPARYQSSRFPGKPLALINGVSLLQHTYTNAKKVKGVDHLVIATDDDRIFEHAKSFGAAVFMTSPHCPTGTDRLAEVISQNQTFSKADIIINIQGDEPVIDPRIIEKVVERLKIDPDAVMATAVIPLKKEEAMNPSVVKCVTDLNGRALYFSRSLIPGGKKGYQPENRYFKHLGIYAYRRDFLLKYATLPETPLQIAEDLEQLKVLEHGYTIQVAHVDGFSIGVDTPEDIQKVEHYLCQQNTSL